MSADMRRRVTTTTPFMEALVAEVQKELSGWRPNQRISFSDALAWIIDDFTWCEPDKPAYGRWSPNMRDAVRRALVVLGQGRSGAVPARPSRCTTPTQEQP